MNQTLVALRGVEFSYEPDRPVLEGVDFELRQGERVALTGPNGSGKTTLLHTIVGLLKVQEGVVEVFGKPRREEKDFEEVRERVGLLFQDPEDQLFCPTVIEDVAFGPLNLGKSQIEAMEVARRTLQLLGLGKYEDRITYRLSHGEKRLVSLATVLAMEPEVLLLDEPLSGLDEETEQRLTSILAELPQSMIVVSHDRNLLRKVSNRAVYLRRGKLEPAELYEVAEGR